MGGLGGKKVQANRDAFSSLVVAMVSWSPFVNLSTGILLLPPSPAGEEVYLCTIQMSGSSALSNQSLQCCLFVCSSILWNVQLASLHSSWMGCSSQSLAQSWDLPAKY